MDLPPMTRLQADPFKHGQALTAALGGESELLTRLAADPDNLLLLDCDEAADAIAWEFATCADGSFLCARAGMLRLVERPAPPAPASDSLHFVALAADPLVDEKGQAREGYRLDLDNELKAIRAVLQESGQSLLARRIPPTRKALNQALRSGPAVLHLTCHGNVVTTPSGPLAILSLEKEDGSADPLTGGDLLNMPPRGVLRMVLLSACHTASGTQANLARALALNGVPFTIGMQSAFPDPLSDDLAVALYDSLFAGMTFGEALRQARLALAQHPKSMGLPVGYAARDGWNASLPLRAGTPKVAALGKPGQTALGGDIQPPRPLLGRNRELHQLAKLYSDGQQVLTIAGTGGMGKTALAATFAERFAWRWPQGVRAYSFASQVNFVDFSAALLRHLLGAEAASQLTGQPAASRREAILDAAREWNGLWLFDNYESIMQGLALAQNEILTAEEQTLRDEAGAIHRLVSDLANGGATLLLTSRERPAGLRNELLFPPGDALQGLGQAAGVELFSQHSSKARQAAREHAAFARAIWQAAEGHPLAIALLAGEYDTSPVSRADFLGNWQDELAGARRDGLAGHHVTFTIAFERSFNHLPPELQRALARLSVFPFPFFKQAAEQVWDGLPLPGDMQTAQGLHELARRSLLEVDANFNDGTPATWRFQPALRQEAARRLLDESEREDQQNGYAAYGAWLAERGYGDIHNDIALNRLVRLSMDALERATETLDGAERLWHIRRLAWLKNAWGETGAAFDLLAGAVSDSLPDPQADPESAKVQSSLRHELAGIYNTRGDLSRALALYEESLVIAEQLGDKKGKAASLSNMAQVYVTRGDLSRALALYEESLVIAEQLGDKKGKAASLSNMAQVYVTRGDLSRALALYEESLALKEQLGDKQGKAASLHQMANVYVTRGDLSRALALYEESLALKEQLGDKQGKAASLHAMANVYVTRGDLSRALALYEESLVIDEQLGDKQGKAASLHAMANVYVTRGDLSRALALYEESLALKEQLGDKQGKAASLGQMANLFIAQGQLEQAETQLIQALNLANELQAIDLIAFNTVKLGQIAQARGERETALARYREGLAIFEQLGMPRESQQVRDMIAGLDLTTSTGSAHRPGPSPERRGESNDPLAQAIGQARAAAAQGNLQQAIAFQSQAAGLARAAGQERENLVTLSVLLYNLAGYYSQADRHEEAVQALEEVVALDEQTGHPDLESDRQALEAARRMASLSPEERAQARQPAPNNQSPITNHQSQDFESQLAAALAQVPPEQRAAAEAELRKALEAYQRMSPEEQAALLEAAQSGQYEQVAVQARDAALAYLRRQAPRKDVLGFLDNAARQAAEGEAPGSPWLEVAGLCRALSALLRGESPPPVPARYAAHFSAVQSEYKPE
jgi:tetratricopeptide (TPR) repeat protein